MNDIDDILGRHTFQGERFNQLRAGGVVLRDKDFEHCEFVSCLFQKARFEKCTFTGCTFERCDMALVGFSQCAFSAVEYVGCKLVGVDWSDAGLAFDATFVDCNLDYGRFADMSLPKQLFRGCSMAEVDLSGAQLQGARFDECDLRRATFGQAALREADLSTSSGLSLDPDQVSARKTAISVDAAVALAEFKGFVVPGYSPDGSGD